MLALTLSPGSPGERDRAIAWWIESALDAVDQLSHGDACAALLASAAQHLLVESTGPADVEERRRLAGAGERLLRELVRRGRRDRRSSYPWDEAEPLFTSFWWSSPWRNATAA